MSGSVDADLIQPDRVTETPTEEPPAPEQAAAPDTPLNIDDDAAVDTALDQAAINLPDGDKLVPMSEAGKVGRAYREKLKELKAELDGAKTTAARANELEQQIAHLSQTLQQYQPYVQAYSAMVQQAQQVATPEDDPVSVEYAQLMELYTVDGKPDVGRARKALAIFERLSQQHAQASVAPIQQQNIQQRSAYNLARAKNTVLPSGVKADPQMLDFVWQQLDPRLTATPEGAKQALVAALGYTNLSAATQTPQKPRGANGQFAAQPSEPVGEPLFTEKAGGKDTPNTLPLSEAERKYLKDVGMTEKDYLASTPPWMRKG